MSDGELSGGETSGDSDDGKARKKRGKKKLKSGMTVKAKDAGIKVKVEWAQSMLGTKKEINFDDMDFNQFVHGESRLINRNKIDQKEETRIHLMQRISKLNSKFRFKVAKELYRDTLNGIKKKEFKWGNITEIQRIEMDIKFDNIKFETESDTDGKKKTVKNPRRTKTLMWFGVRTLFLAGVLYKLIIKGSSIMNRLKSGTFARLGPVHLRKSFTKSVQRTAL